MRFLIYFWQYEEFFPIGFSLWSLVSITVLHWRLNCSCLPVTGGEYYNAAGTPYTQYQTATYPADPAWTMRYSTPTGVLSKSPFRPATRLFLIST